VRSSLTSKRIRAQTETQRRKCVLTCQCHAGRRLPTTQLHGSSILHTVQLTTEREKRPEGDKSTTYCVRRNLGRSSWAVSRACEAYRPSLQFRERHVLSLFQTLACIALSPNYALHHSDMAVVIVWHCHECVTHMMCDAASPIPDYFNR